MHRSSIFVLAALTFCLSLPVHGVPVTKPQGMPTFTGTFKTKDKVGTRGYSKEVTMHPTFLSQKLTGGRLRFFVSCQGGGIHNDHVANLGSTAVLKGNVARFKNGSYELKMEFRPGAVVLAETGDPLDAGFGVGAGVSGTYLLKSASVPDFKKAEKEFGIE